MIVTHESSTAKIVLEVVGNEQRRRIPSHFLVSTTSITRPLRRRLVYILQLWAWGTVRAGFTLAHDTVPVRDPVHVYLVCFLNPLCFLTAFVRPRGKSTTPFSKSSQYHEGMYHTTKHQRRLIDSDSMLVGPQCPSNKESAEVPAQKRNIQ